MAQITSKELSYITDQLSHEQNLVAKFTYFAEQTTDSALKAQYERYAQMHQKHFDALYSSIK